MAFLVDQRDQITTSQNVVGAAVSNYGECGHETPFDLAWRRASLLSCNTRLAGLIDTLIAKCFLLTIM